MIFHSVSAPSVSYWYWYWYAHEHRDALRLRPSQELLVPVTAVRSPPRRASFMYANCFTDVWFIAGPSAWSQVSRTDTLPESPARQRRGSRKTIESEPEVEGTPAPIWMGRLGEWRSWTRCPSRTSGNLQDAVRVAGHRTWSELHPCGGILLSALVRATQWKAVCSMVSSWTVYR